MAAIMAATTLLALALGVVQAMRRATAASRHAVLTASLAATALVSLMNVVAPDLHLPVLPPRYLAVDPHEGTRSTERAVVAQSSASIATGTRVDSPGEDTRAQVGETTGAGLLRTIWIAGAIAGLLRMAVSRLRLRPLSTAAMVTSDERVITQAQHVAEQLRLRRPVAIRVAAGDHAPATWGVMKPTLLLAASSTAWSANRLHVVLLHELGHVARWDALNQMIGQAAVASQWFNPLVWLAAHRARLERERACDDIVLASGVRATTYADELLSLIDSRRSAPRLAVGMTSTTQIERRLRSILASGVNRQGRSRISAMLALAIIGVVPPASLCRIEVAALPWTDPPTNPASLLSAPVASILLAATQSRTRASATVTGYVRTPDNRPIAATDVQLRDTAGDRVAATSRTSALGKFRFDDLPGGSYIVEQVIGSGRVVIATGSRFALRPGEDVATFLRGQIPSAVAQAEAEGRTHPRADGATVLNDFTNIGDVPGTSARQCIDASGRTRSGDFVARLPQQVLVVAGMLSATPLQPARGAATTWSPAYLPPLTGSFPGRMALGVRAIRLDASATDRLYTRDEWSALGSRDGPREFTYILETPPLQGRWMFVATPGPNWGCFLYGSSVALSAP